MKKINLVLALCFSTCISFSQNIYTYAGTGSSSCSGDGGYAINATMSGVGVAVDASGNVYFAGNDRIRKITASTGLISTVAGTGTSGFSGDGGSATSANLSYPSGVFVDGSGNIFIADQNNHRIRKVTASTGNISTVAGNGTAGSGGDGAAATSANLNYPFSVSVDGSGNIYIADYSNHKIRKVTASTGYISTVAGTGTGGYNGDGGAATSAQLKNPQSIEVDGSSNLYIADSQNHRIRKVTASTGIISTVAGNGTSGSSGDGGAATSANLNLPTGVKVDGSGNIYIADYNNYKIRKVTISTGNIGTIGGTGTSGFSGDGGAATSANLNSPVELDLTSGGNIFFNDHNNYRIRAIGTACSANAGSDKANWFNEDCSPECTAVQIGTALSHHTHQWLPCDGTLSSCSVAQPNASPCANGSYTLTVSRSSCITRHDVVQVLTGVGTPCGNGFGRLSAIDAEQIKIYPNPSTGQIMIESEGKIQLIKIMDITGRVVYTKNSPSITNFSIDLSKEEKGVYLIQVTQNGVDRIDKIIIQ